MSQRRPSLRGTCLCEAATYEVVQLDGPIVQCHCRTCRKAHAAAFAATARVERPHFRWLSGAAELRSYPSSPGKLRWFCGTCGTHLVAERPDQPHVILRVATLNDDPGTRPAMHIWTSHDVPWLHNPPALPHHPQLPSPAAAAPAGDAGEIDLLTLLADMQPELAADEFVFVSLPGAAMADGVRFAPAGLFAEAEGLSVICSPAAAQRHGLPEGERYRQITLQVHSSLQAVGLTAAVAERLAASGIAVNMVAGYHHDHLFVPLRDAARAHEVLLALQAAARQGAAGGHPRE